MMRFVALPLALAALAAAAPPMPKVETADGDWSQLPLLQSRGYDHLHSNVMQRLWELAKARQCTIPGYSNGKIDMRLSFAVQYNPDGTIARLVLPKMNCPEAEGIIAGALIEMMQGGDYRPTGKSEEGWYRGNLTFGYEAPA